MTKFMGHWLDESNDERIYIYHVESDFFNIKHGWDGREYTAMETLVPINMDGNEQQGSATVMKAKFFQMRDCLKYNPPYQSLKVERDGMEIRVFKRDIPKNH